MFRTEKQLAELEEINAANWAVWHRRKKWITRPLKLVLLAGALSFAYAAGELNGFELCRSPAATARK
jgi:hypothetical protein